MHPVKIEIFDSTDPQHKTARAQFKSANDLPLICHHGHVDLGLFVSSGTKFKDPAALFIIPDHYVLRMLISQGFSFEELGVFPMGEADPNYDPLSV